ncbi:MAG TPA: CsbD family protein [Pirellulaceae bacterium]|nr:CsbD family protein [Pirellulaceae bacterium]
MNWDTIKGDWKKFKGQIRERWGEFTDDELDKFQGRREQFEGMLQKKYGMAKDEAQRQLDEFEKSCSC